MGTFHANPSRSKRWRHFTVEPKGHTPRHRHDYEHEVLVLSGTAKVVSEDGEHTVGPRTAVFVPANEEHQFRNEGDAPLEFICLIPVLPAAQDRT